MRSAPVNVHCWVMSILTLATAYASEENCLQGSENPRQIDCMLGTSARVAELRSSILSASCYTHFSAGQALLCLASQVA